MIRTLLFLLLSIPALAFGQIEGKGLVCNDDDGGFQTMRGFFFSTNWDSLKRNRGWANHLTVYRDEVSFRNHTISEYKLTPDTIQISMEEGEEYMFYRKSGHIRGDSFQDGAYCDVYQNEEGYQGEMERLKNQYQAQYDKKREGNVL
jgi:hypothetical protein